MEKNRQPRQPRITADPEHHAPLGEPTADLGPGLGAIVGGAAAGAVAGAVGGPISAIAGAALGAIAGGLAVETIEEARQATGHDEYWRSHFLHRPYVEPGATYESYQSAYQFGWESRARHPDKQFDEMEDELRRSWSDGKHQSSLTWERARLAARDAWER